MSIKVSPIDKNIKPEVAIAVNAFLEQHILNSMPADKAWFVYETDGDSFRILGFAACNLGSHIADVPVYHIPEGTTKQEKLAAMRAHELLFARVTGFIADMVGSGTEALFYIAPEAQDKWKEFSKKVNGRNAHRFVMEV